MIPLIRKITVCLFILAVGASPLTHAQELEIDFGVGNFEFNRDRDPGEDEPATAGTAIEFAATFTTPLSDSLSVDVGFERDAILGNTVLSALKVTEGPLQVTIGPTFGLLNTSRAYVRPGIVGNIRVDLFDRVYLSFDARETLAPMTSTGDYRSGLISGSVGLRVRNAIVSAIVDSRRFVEEVSDDDAPRGRTRTTYGVQADIFKEGVPYSVLLDLSWVTRQATKGSPEISDTLRSLQVGAELSVLLTEHLESYVGFDSNVVSFGADELTGADLSDAFLYRVSGGLRLALGR